MEWIHFYISNLQPSVTVTAFESSIGVAKGFSHTYSATFNLVKLTNYQALCLDGSHGAYYLYKGDPTKVILYFEGGGWCGGKD